MEKEEKEIKIVLLMIVKNEEKIIERCLDSVHSIIDYILISDTGSTDQTISIINEYIQKKNLKGALFHDEWKNFGHNRTKNACQAREWLLNNLNNLNNDIELSNTYFFTIDADMIVKIDSSFSKNQLRNHPSFEIQQGNSHINYYNLRFFRADLNYSSIGATHEYWGCDNVFPTILSTVMIDDRGDGGSKSDKFSRDIKLLLKGLEEEPNNERYMFYLAESYRNSGDVENALEWYQKRILAKGFLEEVYISHQKRGELWLSVNQPEKAMMEWLKAYECIPERSETLFRVIQYYRQIGDHNSCFLYLEKALSIPYPKNCILFIEHPVYYYELAEEFSTIAYYLNHNVSKLGGKVCQLLLLSNYVPVHIKQHVMDNSYYYIKRHHQLIRKRHTRLIFNEIKEPYSTSSSCLIYQDKGKIEGNVRCVNYFLDDKFSYVIKDENQIVNTKNYWVSFKDLDSLFRNEPDSFKQIDESSTIPLIVRDANVKGLEDIRLCYHSKNDTYYGLGVSWEYGKHNHPSVVYFSLDKNNKVQNLRPIKYQEEICQKNWVPFFDEKGRWLVVYSHDPLVILELDVDFKEDEKVVVKRDSSIDLVRMRGSSIPVWMNDKKEWLFVVHEVVFRDTRKYYHRIIRYDSDWNLKAVSEPFYMNELYVEFVLSVMYIENTNTLVIPYSNRDQTTEIVEIDWNSLEWISLEIIEKPNRINDFIIKSLKSLTH